MNAVPQFETKKVFVSGRCTEESLRRELVIFGPIKSVVLKETFAFVLYFDDASAARAVAAGSAHVDNAMVRISFATRYVRPARVEAAPLTKQCECGEWFDARRMGRHINSASLLSRTSERAKRSD